jgi:ribosomal-protein-alanine N-acetyltransferase
MRGQAVSGIYYVGMGTTCRAGMRWDVRFSFRSMRLRDALAAAHWRYEGPYAVYDLGYAPLTAWIVQQPLRLAGAEIYYSVIGADGELAGLFSFLRHGRSIEIGVALRPDLTGRGQGIGRDFVEAGLAFARQRFRPVRFTLDVATFNARARRVYEQTGFRPVRVVTKRVQGRLVETLEMEREA